MTPFRFPLEKALEWRRTQLELEENNYRRHLAVLADLDRRRTELSAAGQTAEHELRQWNPVAGGELGALGTFRLHVKHRDLAMAAARITCQQQIDRQQKLMLEARRRVRLLERLRERRLAEWRAAANRELDELASESYLAKWSRRRAAAAASAAAPYNEEHDA